MLNAKALYNIFKMVMKSVVELKKNEGVNPCDVMQDLEEGFRDKAVELISTTHNYDPEYVKDSLLLIGEMSYIYLDGLERDVTYKSILSSMKERIIFLSGGDIRVWVNVYILTRRYGGAEEGGWYYDYMELEESHNVSYLEAQRKLDELKEKYGKGEGDISSVLGGYEVEIYVESERAESETKEVPQYE